VRKIEGTVRRALPGHAAMRVGVLSEMAVRLVGIRKRIRPRKERGCVIETWIRKGWEHLVSFDHVIQGVSFDDYM